MPSQQKTLLAAVAVIIIIVAALALRAKKKKGDKFCGAQKDPASVAEGEALRTLGAY